VPRDILVGPTQPIRGRICLSTWGSGQPEKSFFMFNLSFEADFLCSTSALRLNTVEPPGRISLLSVSFSWNQIWSCVRLGKQHLEIILDSAVGYESFWSATIHFLLFILCLLIGSWIHLRFVDEPFVWVNSGKAIFWSLLSPRKLIYAGAQQHPFGREAAKRTQNYSRVPAHRNWQIETTVWNLAGFLHCAWARGKRRGFGTVFSSLQSHLARAIQIRTKILFFHHNFRLSRLCYGST